MSNTAPFSFTEPITEPDILASIEALPTEDELPCDDGEPMETPRHREQMELLIQSLQTYWTGRTDYYVGGNMFVHYDPEQRQRFRGPDFFAVLDVEPHERRSWVVWREGMRFPDIIIELLSDSTRAIDTGEKKRLYEQVFRTQEYYLYDPFSYHLTGYHLHGARYEEQAYDAQGRISSSVIGLALGVHSERLRWFTDAGQLVLTPKELADQEQQRADQEQQRADQEQQRADQEQQRADQEQQRADQEQQRADQEQQRADQEQQRADQEQQRADQAEQLLQSYRQQYGALK